MGVTSQRFRGGLWRGRGGKLGMLLGGATQDVATIGTGAMSVGDAGNDGAGIVSVIRLDLCGDAVVIDELWRGSHDGAEVSLFGGGRVGKDDESSGIVNPLDLVATIVFLVGCKDLRQVARLELGREAGKLEDAGDQG